MIALPSPRFQVIGMRTVMVVSSSSQFYPESLRFVLTPLSPPGLWIYGIARDNSSSCIPFGCLPSRIAS